MDQLHFIEKRGLEIRSVFEELAALRMQVFREYPYLYEGSLDYEKKYLETYALAEDSYLCAVYNGKEMVGATTCLPLRDETAEIRQPFALAGWELDTIFYFGESMLLPPYRGRGFGHRFFDKREEHARSFGTYEKACFFAVEREDNHPLRPHDYKPNDAFWLKRGYVKQPELQTSLEWPDLGTSESTPKTMVCWMREL
jgi:GNAT superfamily N-acetyltransferase